jgi:hypothetical protein
LRFWIRVAPRSRAVGHDCRTIDASDSASFASSDSSVCIVCIHLPRRKKTKPAHECRVLDARRGALEERVVHEHGAAVGGFV